MHSLMSGICTCCFFRQFMNAKVFGLKRHRQAIVSTEPISTTAISTGLINSSIARSAAYRIPAITRMPIHLPFVIVLVSSASLRI